MNDEQRKEFKLLLAPIVAGLVLVACMQIASLVLNVRIDLFRKNQQVKTTEKIDSNTEAINGAVKIVKATAEEAHQERVRFQQQEQKERADIREYLEEMSEASQ